MKLKRALYLGYYLKQLDLSKYRLFLRYVMRNTGMSRFTIMRDLLRSVFTYNISIMEYFQFRFYELTPREREEWAGTGHMYEYQLRMNPLDHRRILEDKTMFSKFYSEFFVHKTAGIEELKQNPELTKELLSNSSGKMVLKSADGNCGTEVEIHRCDKFDQHELIKYMKKKDLQLVEEFVVQHRELSRLSPSAVNTVRIFTQLDDKEEVEILGCRLRISVDKPVDNMAAGNLAAAIDETSGRLVGPAVYSDITRTEEIYHPVTGVKIPGFEIPYWKETLEMVRKAALKYPQNRSIGWDIVITEHGPGLIEGNHDWCKLLWQLPVKKGLKAGLKKVA